MKTLRFLLAASLLAAGTSACVSIPRAAPEHDRAAKTFAPPPGKANLYVFRDESMGAAVKMSVILDGRILGDSGSGTYVLAAIDPGPHRVVSKAPEADAVLDFTAEADKNVFVWQEVKMGVFSARTALHLVDEKSGRERVATCELVLGY